MMHWGGGVTGHPGWAAVSGEVKKRIVVNSLAKSGHEVWQRNGVMWYLGGLLQGRDARECCGLMEWSRRGEGLKTQEALAWWFSWNIVPYTKKFRV